MIDISQYNIVKIQNLTHQLYGYSLSDMRSEIIRLTKDYNSSWDYTPTTLHYHTYSPFDQHFDVKTYLSYTNHILVDVRVHLEVNLEPIENSPDTFPVFLQVIGHIIVGNKVLQPMSVIRTPSLLDFYKKNKAFLSPSEIVDNYLML